MAFYPYLNFAGTCREAFIRYHETFGGELTLLPMSEVPTDGEVPADQADLTAHAALMLEDGGLLMGSDVPGDDVREMQSIYVNYTVADVAEAERVFEALADGGTVEMPIGETFWSPRFGICRDRFGTPWMVNAEALEEPR